MGLPQCRHQELSSKVDDEKLKLQKQLEDTTAVDVQRAPAAEVKALADQRWKEVETKQAENARLSEELQKQTLALHESAQNKFQLEEERMRHSAAQQAAQQQLEASLRDAAAAAQRSVEVEKALSEAKKEARSGTTIGSNLPKLSQVEAQSKLLEEKARGAQEMASELEAARAEVELQREDARQAREAEHREMQLKEAVELQLQDLTEKFASERGHLEESMREQGQKLQEASEKSQDLEAKLQEAQRAQEEAASKLNDVEEQRQKLQKEELQGKVAAPAAPAAPVPALEAPKSSKLPMGHANLADLVYEATTSREEAVKERHLREQYQQALERLEKEFQHHQPVLMSQRQELLRLKSLTTKLTQQNEGLLERAEQLQCQSADAEERAKKAQSQQQILEEHVRAVAEQLTVLMHENRKLTGAIPANPIDSEGHESNKRSFRTIQELVDQNLSLRRSISQMQSESKGESQPRELPMLRDRNNQLERLMK
eukprot:s2394_g1.t1